MKVTKIIPVMTAILLGFLAASFAQPVSQEGADRELLRQKMEKLKALETQGRVAPRAVPAPAGPASTWGPEVDAAIRKLLDEKYDELAGKAPAGNPAESPAPAETPAPSSVVQKQESAPAAVTPAPIVVNTTAPWTPEVEARIRELLDQGYAEITGRPAPVTAPAVAEIHPPVAETRAPEAIAGKPAETEPAISSNSNWPADLDPIIRGLLDKAYDDLAAGKPVKRSANQVVIRPPSAIAEPEPVAANVPERQPKPAEADAALPAVAVLKSEETTQPAPPPVTRKSGDAAENAPAPIDKWRQKRLTELLQLYKADKITPREYQLERAKIMAPQIPVPDNP